MIPTEIINIILVYIGELNNNMIITQYNPITNKEYYKINFYSDLLWKIKSTLVIKRIYPIYIDGICYMDNSYIELYKFAIPHYENELRQNRIK
jgi:hypothetical protein